MAAMEIHMAREEIRRLCRELARTVLQKAIEKDGTVWPDGAAGDQIRRAMGIMDGPITQALQLGAAPEALEIWRVHTEHINRVFENGGKGRGRQNATYHPKLMNFSVEWFFGDARQMVGGSANKLTAADSTVRTRRQVHSM